MKSPASQLEQERPLPCGLYVVATPIGNLEDITLRALRVLRGCDVIACEDTRVSRVLLSHYGIQKPLISYNDHNGQQRRPEIMGRLGAGEKIALISDAGTPLISDPGYKLVRDVRDAGHDVFTIPGASSVTAALSISGMPTDRYLFLGFPPAKSEALREWIAHWKQVDATLVLLESPRRLPESLEIFAAALGAREAAVARELTKLYEELRRDSLPALAEYYREHGAPKGEVVLLIGPPVLHEKQEDAQARLDNALLEALAQMTVKDAAAAVAARLGLPRKSVYARALELAVRKP